MEGSPSDGERSVNNGDISGKNTQEQIKADFAANREAIKREGFKKGEEVEFTNPGPFTNPDGTVDQERVYRGTIGNLGDKEQAVVRVDVPGRRGVADYHVPASRLRRPGSQSASVPKVEQARRGGPYEIPAGTSDDRKASARVLENAERGTFTVYQMSAGASSGGDGIGSFKMDESGAVSSIKPRWEWAKYGIREAAKQFAAEQSAALPPVADRAPPRAGKNTIFTAEAADAARKRLKSKLTQANSGIDPEMIQDGIALAGYHIEKGARTFAAYGRAMVADLGDVVKPYLKSWYMGVKYDPRAAAFDGMDSAAAVESADVDALQDQRSNAAGRAAVDAAEDPQAEISRLRAQNEALQAQVDTDTLTGTRSRDAYRRDNPKAKGVAFIDLIAFKGYNTKFTETGGDAILAEFGRIMAEVAGTSAYRRGGDEFALLSDRSPEDAAAMAERLQAEMAKVVIEMTDKNGDAYEVRGIPFRTGVGATDEQAVADSAR